MSYKQPTARPLLAALLALAAPHAWGQAAPAPAANAATDSKEDEAVVLSPFLIEASEDAQSYSANSTLAGTRVRTDLRDIASSISVVTKRFLQDTGATGNASLLQYTPSTEVGGLRGNFSGVGTSSGQYEETSTLLRPNNNTRVRGLDSADNTRDYFLSDIPWDGYIVDRVDLQRGPNSILFGVGSPAGIINTSINTAGFKNAYSVENRLDRYGSIRNSFDFNQVILRNELSVRVAGLNDQRRFQQKPAFEDDRRIFAALRWEPKLFGDSAHTSIRANFENGDINANRPRTLPPVDQLTPWFYTGTDQYGVAGLAKRTQNAATDDRSRDIYANYPWYGGSGVGRQFWPSTVAYYNANNSTPLRVGSPMLSTKNGIGPDGKVDGSIAGQYFVRPFSINNFDDYANKAGIPGGAYYMDKSLADPSIFNFFDNLIDGDNKHEWSGWNAANFVLNQTFLDGRAGFEVNYNMQRYNDGQIGFLGNGGSYALSIDINDHYVDGTPNPNVGRPFVASSTEGGNNATDIDRDGLRVTAFGDLRAEDFLGKSTLSRILGHHVVTGLYTEDTKKQFSRSWAQSAADPTGYPALIGESPSIANHIVAYDWQVYLGPSLSNRSSASGANLSRITTLIETPQSVQTRYFDNRWARSTVPGSANYVDPSAPYTYTNSAGVPVVSTQSENPANYGGWKDAVIKFRTAKNGDIDDLYTASSKEKTTVKSRAFTWQGYLWDGNFVPVFGWRRDEVRLRQGDAVPDTALGTVKLGYDYDDTRNRFVAGESKSWGGVLHIPEKWTSRLPGKTNFSVFYNRSENFKADAPRQDVFGQIISNPIGETKEYGFAVSTLDNKLNLKVNWYKTTVQNATISGDTGFNYLHWAVPAWGIAHVAAAQAGLMGLNNNNAWLWNYAGNAGVPGGPGDAAWEAAPETKLLRAAVADWKNLPLTQDFFNSYGNELAQIDVSKVKAGDYMGAWPKWAQGRADPQPGGTGVNRVAAGDTESNGVEIELSAQPIRNWNITANVTKVQSMRTAISPTISGYMDSMTKFLAGPAGDLRIWGGGDPFRKVWADEAVSRYNVLLTQIGSTAPEVSPWRFNAISTWDFDRGALKGTFVGGAFRWEDKRILSYTFDPTKKALDVAKPLYGPADDHFDLWVGYTRKVFTKYQWRIQLNFRNVGEKTKLVPVTLQPDGSPALSRIQEGMTWQLTNNIAF